MGTPSGRLPLLVILITNEERRPPLSKLTRCQVNVIVRNLVVTFQLFILIFQIFAISYIWRNLFTKWIYLSAFIWGIICGVLGVYLFCMWMAFGFLIIIGYEIVQRLCCPQCGGFGLRERCYQNATQIFLGAPLNLLAYLYAIFITIPHFIIQFCPCMKKRTLHLPLSLHPFFLFWDTFCKLLVYYRSGFMFAVWWFLVLPMNCSAYW